MGMFGEIAREGMGVSLISRLIDRAKKGRLSKQSLKLLLEVSGWVTANVDYPSQEYIDLVEKLKSIVQEKTKCCSPKK